MYQTTQFEILLTREAGLLSLQKSDCDLFLIAQTNIITYSQLRSTSIHGHTGTGGRLSLKKLEAQGYLSAKSVPNSNGQKYYMLTAKGKKRLEKVFSSQFLKDYGIDLERRPPTSQFQLPHRINTSDLYCAFISCPSLKSVPRWTLEYGYAPPTNPYSEKEHPPRCDARLETKGGIYYLEQDNGTQGDAALENKIKQYLDSDLFIGNALQRNRLVFTSMAEVKEKPAGKPPYTVYRLLLKAICIWNTIEQTTGTTYDFAGICRQITEGTHPARTLLSGAESRVLQNLSLQHPTFLLSDMTELKKQYLYDSTIAENRKNEQDAVFQKRLELRFHRMTKDRKNAMLLFRLQQGMHLYILPNHRIKDWLPYLFTEEYDFSERVLKFLYGKGLYNIESWSYHPLQQIQDRTNVSYWFSNVLESDKQNHIIFEDICHDLGGQARVLHFLSTQHGTDPVILFLFTVSKQDAARFYKDVKQALERPENNTIYILFIDKTEDFGKTDTPVPYCIHLQGEMVSYAPVDLDYDGYNEQIQINERQVKII